MKIMIGVVVVPGMTMIPIMIVAMLVETALAASFIQIVPSLLGFPAVFAMLGNLFLQSVFSLMDALFTFILGQRGRYCTDQQETAKHCCCEFALV